MKTHRQPRLAIIVAGAITAGIQLAALTIDQGKVTELLAALARTN